MKAAFFTEKNKPLVIKTIDKFRPVKDQVLIRLQNAALNHRDLWAIQEQTAPAAGVILGSDGCGVVEAVGEGVDEFLIGSEVIINPSINWGNNPIVQGDSFKILGFPDHGTFSEYIVISNKYVFQKPEHLSMMESTAIPLSGLTAYRALFSKARLRSKEKVLITGVGGGTAQFAFQFALAYDARVYVTSGSDEKIARAKKMGAIGGFNYKDEEWPKKATKEAGGFDIVIDGAGGEQFSMLPDIMMPGGRIVVFGRTGGNIPDLPTRSVFWKQLSIFGSTMGTRDEFLSMIDMMESRNIKPVIDSVYPLEEINEAFDRMNKKEQFGKIVLAISNT